MLEALIGLIVAGFIIYIGLMIALTVVGSIVFVVATVIAVPMELLDKLTKHVDTIDAPKDTGVYEWNGTDYVKKSGNART